MTSVFAKRVQNLSYTEENMSENQKNISDNTAKSEEKAAKKEKKPSPRKKKKVSAGKIIIIAIAAIALLLVLFPGLRSCAVNTARKIPGVNKLVPSEKVGGVGAGTYNYYTVTSRDITTTLTGTGTLQAYDSYNITATVTGDILSADFEEMDEVNEDDVLFVIDSADIREDIEDKKKDVADALEDINDLYEDYEDLKIYSDYSGKVRELYVEAGDRVADGTAIAYVVDSDTMLLDIPFFAANTDHIEKGAVATVTFSSTGEQLFGTVTEISNLTSVNAYNSTIRNITIAVSNPGGITFGMKAYASVVGNDGITYDCSGEGSFKYNEEETVRAESSGELSAVYIDDGDYVKKGDLVAQISSENLDDQLENLNKAYDNQKKALEDLEERLEDYTITAPISGTVVQKNYKELDTIGSSSMSTTTNLAIIYDMSKLTFDMNIDELDLSLIKVGQKVNITSDSLDNMVFEGVITKKSIVGSSTGGTTVYPVTVEVEGNDHLLPGMNVDAEIILSSTGEVPAIPVAAVGRGNIVEITKAQVERPMGTFDTKPETETVKVEIGATDGDYIEIRSGLSVGDVVVYEVKNIQVQDFNMLNMMSGMGGNMGGMPQGGMPQGGNFNRGNMGGNRGTSAGGFGGR